MTYRTLLAATACVALAAPAFAGTTSADAFNRAKLGSAWTITGGTESISGDQLHGSSGALGQFTPAKGTAASAILFLGGTDLEYGAVAVGNISGGTNAFVKLQEQNGDGQFEYGAFYSGNNSGSDFFALTTPVPSPATLDVGFCGTTAYMRITSAAGVQTYKFNYGSSVGTGGGLGTYGSIGLDNFISYVGNCKGLDQAISVERLPHARDLSLTH